MTSSRARPCPHLPALAARRRWLAGSLATAGLSWLPARAAAADAPLSRAIPSSGEKLPVLGLGSWITFNVGTDRAARETCTDIVRAFFEAGGRLIDSSPMYGSSQPTIGHALSRLGRPAALFAAEKVWTSGDGDTQMAASRAHWGLPRFDLVQVHNLLAWREHLPRLFDMKAAGTLRYVGITTSHGRRHDDMLQIMRTQPIDFVQLSYHLANREAERRLLPLARERGIAVIVNRPLDGGALPDRLRRHRLPAWAAEIGCTHWAQVALKFVVGHPAVTCTIPATSQLTHLRQNMAAAHGALPDAALRERMAQDAARWL